MSDDMMPSDPAPLPEVRFLKVLVTTLAGTMIFGLLAIIWLLVTRLGEPAPMPSLPKNIDLPAGAIPVALTFATDRVVVLTEDDRVLVYAHDGRLIGQTALVTP
ncbi:MAG: DUF6476 family protein [Paenirhodobacter sp.]|uniref:DUF6476 family protein n=1 Tax=Paenirhodobacter sp. TaxID=1965326 RepID=UPI003D13FAE0